MSLFDKVVKRLYRSMHNRLYATTSYDSDKVLLGRDVYIAPGSMFEAKETRIGDDTRINGPIRVHGFQRVEIGKYCAFGSYITMVSSNHVTRHANLQGMLHRRFGFVSLMDDDVPPIIVGHNVWMGDNATLLPGVAVGDGAVVGAASVVTRDIPPFTVAAGAPARCIKQRFSDSIIQTLLDIRWWDWPGEKIARNRAFFEADLTSISAEKLRSLIVEV